MPSVRPAPCSSPRRCTSSSAATRAPRWSRCAAAAASAPGPSSSASDPTLPFWRHGRNTFVSPVPPKRWWRMHRITWAEVPVHVRAAIEDAVSAPVVRTDGVEGGFSPCLAATLHLRDGRRVFAKAVSAAQNPDAPSFIRRELDAVAALPHDLAVPKLLATYDDGDWIAGVFEHVDGRLPGNPWDAGELARALDALARINAVAAPALLPS